MANTIFALVFPGIVSAFGTFFLRQAYLGIPNEIGEAAYLDGCNQWQTFTKVMFPLTSSSVAALCVFTAVFAYSDLTVSYTHLDVYKRQYEHRPEV